MILKMWNIVGKVSFWFWKDTAIDTFFRTPGNMTNLNLNLGSESLFWVQFQLPDLMQLGERANNKVANSLATASGSQQFNDLWLWFLEEDRYLYLHVAINGYKRKFVIRQFTNTSRFAKLNR